MVLRWIFILAVSLGVPSFAFAGEQSGVARRVSCSVVRFYVAKYSEMAAEQWARSKGATDAEISRRDVASVPTPHAPPGHRQGRLRSAPTAGDRPAFWRSPAVPDRKPVRQKSRAKFHFHFCTKQPNADLREIDEATASW